MKGKYRKGVFVVVFKKLKNKVVYLLLHRKLHWKGWEFLKGGKEKGENLIDCVRREVKEESGLKIKQIFDMKKSGKFNYKKELVDRKGIIGQKWRLFCVEVVNGKVRIDRTEHNGFKWVNFEKGKKMLKWANQKNCLKIVNEFLNKELIK
ncbi:MAG: NUDIX domain-containing protein [Candidatus Pacearchaeota archaeon]|nr:NUDIX domain-containing protein [Candidatus Pacearchaeota archaeon]